MMQNSLIASSVNHTCFEKALSGTKVNIADTIANARAIDFLKLPFKAKYLFDILIIANFIALCIDDPKWLGDISVIDHVRW